MFVRADGGTDSGSGSRRTRVAAGPFSGAVRSVRSEPSDEYWRGCPPASRFAGIETTTSASTTGRSDGTGRRRVGGFVVPTRTARGSAFIRPRTRSHTSDTISYGCGGQWPTIATRAVSSSMRSRTVSRRRGSSRRTTLSRLEDVRTRVDSRERISVRATARTNRRERTDGLERYRVVDSHNL